MNWLNIIQIILSIIVGIFGTAIPFLYKLSKSVKNVKNASTELEKEKATNDMIAMVNTLVAESEKAYNAIDKVLKANGDTAGAMKFENVFIKLQAYALQQGYEFDAEYWTTQIKNIVAFTQEVNSKKSA